MAAQIIPDTAYTYDVKVSHETPLPGYVRLEAEDCVGEFHTLTLDGQALANALAALGYRPAEATTIDISSLSERPGTTLIRVPAEGEQYRDAYGNTWTVDADEYLRAPDVCGPRKFDYVREYYGPLARMEEG